MQISIRDISANKWLNLALRSVVGFIFVYAAVEKLSHPEEFARAITNYHILPLGIVNITAIILPWIELLAGLSLIGSVHVRSSSLLIMIMLGIFSIAIVIALARGLDISCGCFSPASASRVGWKHLLENLALIAGVVVIFFFSRAENTSTTPP